MDALKIKYENRDFEKLFENGNLKIKFENYLRMEFLKN